MLSQPHNMDDSQAALIKAYNTVRERYNKLRLHCRQLLKDKTCPQCRQKMDASPEAENSPDRQTASVICQRSSSDANEIHEICDQLKQLVEAGQVADGPCPIQSIIPRLQNIASRIAMNKTFDERQESLLNASTSEMLSSLATLSHSQLEASAADLLQSQQSRVVANLSETFEASKLCEMAENVDQRDKHFITGKLSTTV